MPYEFTNEEYADMHFVYGYSNGNAAQAQREYARRFPNRRIPERRTFESVHRRLRERGSFQPYTGDRPGHYYHAGKCN